MDDRWVRLGKALAADRKAQNLTQDDIVARASLSLATVQGIERGNKVKDVTPSMRVYAAILGWGPGSIETVLDGGNPLPARPGEAAVPTDVNPAGPLEGLPLRIAEALKGQRLDYRVMPLDGGGKMVVFVTNDHDASAEATKASLLAWEKREQMLEQLGEELPDEPSEKE